MFWDTFYELCEKKGTKPNPIGKKIGVSSGIITKWKSGAIPNGETLIKIADYLDCSIDYLLGREERTQAPPQIQKSNRTISVEDQKTFDLYLQLDLYDKGEIRGEMKQMLKADKYREEILEKNA